MPRYIDAEKLLNRMMQDPLFPLVERYGVSGVIEAEPTTDVVEVVRCKDCKHYVNDRLKKDYSEDKRFKRRVCVASEYAILRDPNWFCADGERRE